MKVSKYSQMMSYLTRPSKSTDPTQVEKDLAQKQLEKYALQSDSTGAYEAFKKKRARENKIDGEIISFGKNFQPHKEKINSKYDPDEWLKHNAALYRNDGSSKKDLIEDVQLESNGEMRGMLTKKIYNAGDAINMNEKYDRNFTNPKLGKKKSTYLTANEKVLANFNPTEALEYTDRGKDKENVQYMRYVKAKARRINEADAAQTKLTDPKILKDDINDKKINKVALLTDEQEKDPKIIDLEPHLPSFEDIIKQYEKEKQDSQDEVYRIKLPRNPIEANFAKLVLQNDLQKQNDATSGIGKFDRRTRFAGGSNGSTPNTPQIYQKQIEDLYGIQLTGHETIAELLEVVKELNEKN